MFDTIAVDRVSGGSIAANAGDVDGALWNDGQVVSVNVNEWGVRVKYSSGSVTMARGSGRRGGDWRWARGYRATIGHAQPMSITDKWKMKAARRWTRRKS